MVASAWGLGHTFMLATFGWKSPGGHGQCDQLGPVGSTPSWPPCPKSGTEQDSTPVPEPGPGLCGYILAGIVLTAHHPPVFMALFLFCLGISHAHPQFQNRLVLKEAFAGGVLPGGAEGPGGCAVVVVATFMRTCTSSVLFRGDGLTAVTDNAADHLPWRASAGPVG